MAEEEPADTIIGLVYSADDDSLFCEFEWMDSLPTSEDFQRLMSAAEEALHASAEG